jgi:hypothetical protein
MPLRPHVLVPARFEPAVLLWCLAGRREFPKFIQQLLFKHFAVYASGKRLFLPALHRHDFRDRAVR